MSMKSVTKISKKKFHKKCPQKVSTKSVHKKCAHKVSTKSRRGAEGERKGSGR